MNNVYTPVSFVNIWFHLKHYLHYFSKIKQIIIFHNVSNGINGKQWLMSVFFVFGFFSHINFVLAKCLHVVGDEEIKKSSEINKQMFSFDKMEMQNKYMHALAIAKVLL